MDNMLIEDEGKKRILFAIIKNGYNEVQYGEMKTLFAEEGYSTQTTSVTIGECHGLYGSIVDADLTIQEVDYKMIDCLVFVGGGEFFEGDDILRLIQNVNMEEKLICALSSSPILLARAGVAKGKRMSTVPSLKDEIQALGAIFCGDETTEDGNILTSDGTKASEIDLAQKIILLLGEDE